MIKLPISKAHQWTNCNGSALMQALHPEDQTERSEQREEGIAAHWLAVQIIGAFTGGEGSRLICSDDMVGQLSPNDVVITKEMYESVVDYTNDIFRYCNKHGLLRHLKLEEKVDMSWYSPDQSGFIDASVYNPDLYELVIWEFKYGHLIVEAFENPQLAGYAASKILELGQGHVAAIDLRVVQPRSHHVDGPVRKWELDPDELRSHVMLLTLNASAASGPDAECTPHVDACGDCSGRHACDALAKNVYAAIDYAEQAQPLTLDAQSISVETRLLRRGAKLLKSRQSGIESQALAEIKKGVLIPGFSTVQGYGHQKWNSDAPLEEVEMMGDLMGVDCRKPREIDTPSQLIKKGVDADVINSYSYRGRTAVKLVEDSGSKARQVFRAKKEQ